VLLAAAAGEHDRRRLDRRTPLLVVLTSGSSGRPRAVVRTVASWAASLPGYTALTRQTSRDVTWTPGGPASTLTLFALWHALATGVPVLAGAYRRGAVAAAPAADAVTVAHAVPAVAADLLAARLAGELPRLRRVVVAGAPVPATVREAAGRAGVDFVEYYGAAELSFVAADPDGRGLRPFPGVRLRVREGRIEVRSPYLGLGYLGDAAGPLTVDADCWAGVGDLGRLGPDGVLAVAGRGDEVISVGGDVVLAADVERVLAAVPGVAEVVSLGAPSDRLGWCVVAVVRPAPGLPGDSDLLAALRGAARSGLPRAARPVRYILVDELPRAAGGKVARGPLSNLLADLLRDAGAPLRRAVT
jgi:long-chain acyl-CoA synthetase